MPAVTEGMQVTVGPRRAEVLRLIQEGKSVRDICRELDMSQARVYQHVDALRAKGLLPPKEGVA